MAWTRPPDQADALAQLSQLDDLGEFFEFTDLDLNNLPYADPTAAAGGATAPGTHPSTPFEELGEMQAMNGTAAKDFAAMQEQVFQHQQQQHQQQQHQLQHRFTTSAPTSHPFVAEAIYQATMQQNFHPNQQQFAFPQQSGYPANANVPPTPNSFEMHGETGRFMQNLPPLDPQQRAILEQRYQLRKEDVAFTPMVSPAGTPSQFAVQDYTVNPGAYFSPLTSPALHAQNTAQFQHGYHPSAAAATSPLDANGDVDMTADDALLPESATAPKKPRLKRTNTPRTADPLARVRQSPIQKAVKRKSASMLTGFGDQTYKQSPRGPSSQPGSAGLTLPAAYGHDNSSESGSISPEPLSEALMGPPPRPASMTASPALPAQQGMAANGTTASPAVNANGTPLGKAATPKSFLSMHGMHAAATAAGNEDGFVDIELPAAAAGDDGNALRPALPQLNTQVNGSPSTDGTPGTATTVTSAASTPRVAAARKTPKLGPSSTPASSAALLASPMTASTPGALLRKSGSANSSTDAKTPGNSTGGRGSSKKRSSISSNAPGSSSASTSNGGNSALVSPALRPKISPSIKPLLPEGSTLHSPTHALLLASKSNYQNLLEGNMLPGVSYPDSLSTGLTSKRTSHKVAEQGRRNRINEALKEMQALLPPKPAVAANGKSPAGGKEGSGSGKDDGEKDDDGSPAAAGGDAKDATPKDAAAAAAAAQAKSNSSKAATVESANEYIRQLQKENAEVAALRRQLAEVQMQLARVSAVAGVCVPEAVPEEEGEEGEEAARKVVGAEAVAEAMEVEGEVEG